VFSVSGVNPKRDFGFQRLDAENDKFLAGQSLVEALMSDAQANPRISSEQRVSRVETQPAAAAAPGSVALSVLVNSNPMSRAMPI
jgi:hypothetical protein